MALRFAALSRRSLPILVCIVGRVATTSTAHANSHKIINSNHLIDASSSAPIKRWLLPDAAGHPTAVIALPLTPEEVDQALC
jgi:hypothetical protein